MTEAKKYFLSKIKNKRAYELFKVVILGECYVGKTCLLSRFTDDVFLEAYVSTIGCEFVIFIFLIRY